jgi:hypothetical protein
MSDENGKEFRMVLYSNAHTRDFPYNSHSFFRARLPHRYELSGEWRVALLDVQMPHAWNNWTESCQISVLAPRTRVRKPINPALLDLEPDQTEWSSDPDATGPDAQRVRRAAPPPLPPHAYRDGKYFLLTFGYPLFPQRYDMLVRNNIVKKTRIYAQELGGHYDGYFESHVASNALTPITEARAIKLLEREIIADPDSTGREIRILIRTFNTHSGKKYYVMPLPRKNEAPPNEMTQRRIIESTPFVSIIEQVDYSELYLGDLDIADMPRPN